MEILITIIMPVFNGAQFIRQTLESLCPQLTDKVELIIVDDGSKDDTLTIIQKYFSSFVQAKQLRVLSQTNQGVSAARNLGIENAYGNYIGFMDADDLALPNYIPLLLNAVAKNADIVEFGFKTFVNTLKEASNNQTLYSNNQFGSHNVANIIDKVYGTSRWYPWSRLFKKHLLQGIRFPVGIRFCEDLMTIPQLYENAQTILVLPDALYGYRTNPDSATFKVGVDYVENLIAYYHSIPTSDLIRHDFLRISVAFGIVSCHIKSTGDWVMPQKIQKSLNRLRWKWQIYHYIEPRKLAMLLYPNTFKLFRKWIKK